MIGYLALLASAFAATAAAGLLAHVAIKFLVGAIPLGCILRRDWVSRSGATRDERSQGSMPQLC